MPWNIGSRRINNVCQINLGEELFDKFLAELPFHERVSRNHAKVATPLII